MKSRRLMPAQKPQSRHHIDQPCILIGPELASNSVGLERWAISAWGRSRHFDRAPLTSGLPRWSQPVDATLYLRGKRWSVGWNEDFIEVLPRQRRRSYGIAGSAGSR